MYFIDSLGIQMYLIGMVYSHLIEILDLNRNNSSTLGIGFCCDYY